MDRRRLVTGAEVGDAARGALGRIFGLEDDFRDSDSRLKRDSIESTLQHFTFNAMGCSVQMFFPAGEFSQVGDAVTSAMDLVENLENCISVYRSGSDLSRLNQLARKKDVLVAEPIADLIDLAMSWSTRTNGAFDCTMGPLSRLWGFRARNPVMPGAGEIERARESIGSQVVQWDCETKKLRLLHDQAEIDFNGIGKGWILDRVSQLLSARGLDRWLIHAGESSVTARGDEFHRADSASEAGWKVGVAHPLLAHCRLAEIRLQNQSIGTSGSARQVLIKDGQRYGHVLDPRTGWPANHWTGVTVVNDCPVVCDVLSTALFVMDSREVARFAAENPQVKMLLVRQDDESNRTEVVSYNFIGQEMVFCQGTNEKASDL